MDRRVTDVTESATARLAKATKALSMGDYASAKQALKEVAADAEGKDDTAAAAARWHLAKCLVAEGRTEQAAQVYALVAEHHTRALAGPPTLPLTAARQHVRQLETIGTFFVDNGNSEDAHTILHAALSEAQRQLPEGAIEFALILFQLGRVSELQQDLIDAEANYRASIARFGAANAPSLWAVTIEGIAWARHRLAETLALQRRHEEAQTELIAAYDVLLTRYPSDAPELGYLLVSMARGFSVLGQLSEAEECFRRSIVLGAERLDHDPVEAADRITELAQFLWDLGRFEEADEMFQRAVAHMSAALGPHDPMIAAILQHVSDLYWDQGLLEQAGTLCEEALALLDFPESGRPPEELAVAATLHQLASIRFEQGHHMTSEKMARRALAVFEHHLPESAETAATLNLLGQIARIQEDLQAATSFLQRAIAMLVTVSGETDPGVIMSVNNLAQVALQSGDGVGAETTLRWIINVARPQLGTDHPQVELSLDLLSQILAEDGRPDEAEEMLRWAELDTLQT